MSTESSKETHAAIIAEMRNPPDIDDVCPWWADGGDCNDCPLGGKGKNCSFTKFADRLEAAHKRELAAGGNAAKLREALKRCEAISHFPEIREQQCVKDMRNIIAHALAAPPRNCEVGTAEEQAERFKAYCGQEVCKRASCQFHAKASFIGACAIAWAQMPYEEKEGGAE